MLILSGINLKTAAVNKVLGLSSCITLDVHKIIDHLVNKLVFKIAVDRVG